MPTNTASNGVNLDNTLGALQVSVPIAIFLFSILCLQIYYFFENYPNDRFRIKILLSIIWIFEVVDIASLFVLLYNFTITLYGKFPAFLEDKVPWTLLVNIFFSCHNNIFVQCTFAYRVKHLSGRWEVTILSWLSSLSRSGLVIADLYLGVAGGSLPNLIKMHKNVPVMTVAVGLIQDSVVSMALIYYIPRKYHASTREILKPKKMLFFLAETGLLQCLLGAITVIMISLQPFNFIWLGVHAIAAETYANTLLLTINGRRDWRNPYANASPTRNQGLENFAAHQSSLPEVTVDIRVDMATGDSEADRVPQPVQDLKRGSMSSGNDDLVKIVRDQVDIDNLDGHGSRMHQLD